jgi:hypothetical protein
MRKHLFFLLISLAACSSSSGTDSSPTASATGLKIVTASGAPLQAVAGDALPLKVVLTFADGSTQDLPSGANVTWSGPPTVTASDPNGTPADNPYPTTGADPTAIWIGNPPRTDRDGDLDGVLFVLDAGMSASGSVMVTASVSGATQTGPVSATVSVGAGPTGDATRGMSLYGASGANCAACHGPTGHGSDPSTNGMYAIDGMNYPFPAPGLNAEDGNAGAEWSPALFAIAARADLDDEAVSLRLPMPDWLTGVSPATGKPLSTQDLADIFAFMATQTM